VKNVYREQVCLNGTKGSKKCSESENAKIADENIVYIEVSRAPSASNIVIQCGFMKSDTVTSGVGNLFKGAVNNPDYKSVE
jgi:hypothetical protein